MSGILFFIFASCHPLTAAAASLGMQTNGIEIDDTHAQDAISMCQKKKKKKNQGKFKFSPSVESLFKSIQRLCNGHIIFNGSQLAKMKKSIPDMSLPWNL